MACIAVVFTHDGNGINAGAPVAQELVRRGHEVIVYLQRDHSAAQSYQSGGKIADMLAGFNVHVNSHVPLDLSKYATVALCTSTPKGENLEVEFLKVATKQGIPRFALEEVVAGRHNPSWRDHLSLLTAIFAAMPESGFTACEEVVVGPNLSRWRGDKNSVSVRSKVGRTALGLHNEPVLYFFPSPSLEGALGLERLADVLWEMKADNILPGNTVFLLNRHRREVTQPVEGNGMRFRVALGKIARTVGLHVIDCSPEFRDLPETDDRSILPEFRPAAFPSYAEMLAVTSWNGAALTFYGTDAQMIAPYLSDQGILPILWLDPDFGGKMMMREKGFDEFTLPLIPQPANDGALKHILLLALHETPERQEFCREMSKQYPFPDSEPAVLIVNGILQRLGMA